MLCAFGVTTNTHCAHRFFSTKFPQQQYLLQCPGSMVARRICQPGAFPENSLGCFCIEVPLIRYSLVNNFPQHPRRQISGKFFQCDTTATSLPFIVPRMCLLKQALDPDLGELAWVLYLSSTGSGFLLFTSVTPIFFRVAVVFTFPSSILYYCNLLHQFFNPIIINNSLY